jgi:hypothetical protein
MMKEVFAKQLSGQLGKFLKMNLRFTGYMCVGVEYPLHKALILELKVKIKGRGLMLIIVRYENVPYFCFTCKRIGHVTLRQTVNKAMLKNMKSNMVKSRGHLRHVVPGKLQSGNRTQRWQSLSSKRQCKLRVMHWGIGTCRDGRLTRKQRSVLQITQSTCRRDWSKEVIKCLKYYVV